ncbi:unnamed protein product [Sphagnum balticum]
MIEFARKYVDELTIVVDEHAQDLISGSARLAWLKDAFPDLSVQRIVSEIWHKSDDADFSPKLLRDLRKIVPKRGGHIFCLQKRGQFLAEALGATYIPVDLTALNMEALGNFANERLVHKQPMLHWSILPECVRPYYVRRVCIFGPESTGKSTLALQLAEHFASVAVPEYAKTYIENNGKDIDENAMLNIARGQCAAEDALARKANRVLFCDSDLVTSSIWSGRLIGSVPAWLNEQANRRQYDLYLLTHYDVPWVDDVHRYIPKESPAFFDRCVLELESRQRNFVQIQGNWDERLALAVKAVEDLIATPYR